MMNFKITVIFSIIVLAGLVGSSAADIIKEYDSINALLAENDLLFKQLEIIVGGKEIKSPPGCPHSVYYESAILNQDGLRKVGPHSAEPFYIYGTKHFFKVKVIPDDKLRLFIAPTSKKENKVNYCLQKRKKYYLYLKKESFAYGPPDKEGKRRRSEIIFIQISDKEFKNGQPQVEPTPTYKGWIYG